MAISRIQELKKSASLLRRLLFQKFAQGFFGVFSDNKAIFLSPRLALFLRLRFWFVRHRYNGKLDSSVWGMKSAPDGDRTRKAGFSHPIASRDCLPIPAPGHKRTGYGGEGRLNSQLASAWFGLPSNALIPSSS